MNDGNPSGYRYLLMPDSFKGTMSAMEVCDIMKRAILQRGPDAQVVAVPVADGGEGTVDCFLYAFGGERRTVTATGPYGEKKEAFYGIMGDTAVVEMAAAAGFSTEDSGKRDPSSATTFGVGELIRAAVEGGARKIILGLGGSCTNDGGAGMAAALGTVFYDESGQPFVPTGGTLKQVKRIDIRETKKLLSNISIEVMCDIDNPLYGPQGAAYVFAPQKGADEKMVRMLDDNLRAFAVALERETGQDVSKLPGGGAAGGMGAGAYALLGAKLSQGIDVILDMMRFEELARGCKAIFTGEGRFDSQSLGGKVVVGIGRRARRAGIPVIVVAGRVAEDLPGLADVGISSVYQTAARPYRSRNEMLEKCRKDLFDTMIRALDCEGL